MTNTDSAIGYVSGVLTSPSPVAYADSTIGYATGKLGPQPGVYVHIGAAWVHHVPNLWDGTKWVTADFA